MGLVNRIERGLVAAVFITVAGCKSNETPSPTPSLNYGPSPGIVELDPGHQLNTGSLAWVCAGRRMILDGSETIEARNSDGTPNNNAVVVLGWHEGYPGTIAPAGQDPIYCETAAGHPSAINDVESEFPAGTLFVSAIANEPTPPSTPNSSL